MSLTPMMEQYLRIKQDHQDTILFFHLGDFYEMFFTDAEVASQVLEITLTGRDGGALGRVPMCGIPCHAVDGYLTRLVDKGYKVAICEQVEDPKAAKGVVRREVTRVVTPGTVIEGQLLDDKTNNYLCSVFRDEERWALCACDVSTGELDLIQGSESDSPGLLVSELNRLGPREIIVPNAAALDPNGLPFAPLFTEIPLTITAAREAVRRQFGDGVSGGGWADDEITLAAVGGLLHYLSETQKRPLGHIQRVRCQAAGQYMLLDQTTRRNLELTRCIADGMRKGSLLAVLDHTATAMGGRLLRNWLERPLLQVSRITLRQQAVKAIVDDAILRDSLHRSLKQIYDLERLAGRVAYGTANARDLLALAGSLRAVAELRKILASLETSPLREIATRTDPCSDLCEFIERSVSEDAPVGLHDGGLIKPGFDGEVDRLRDLAVSGKEWLCGFEAREKDRTGIRSLKVGYNRVFGYYIEVTKTNLAMVPGDYVRRQTLANAERFVTQELKEYEEKIVGARDRLLDLEYSLFLDIRSAVNDNIKRLQDLAMRIARLDALTSLAIAAARYGYFLPEVNEGDSIEIAGGRHPVVEQALGTGGFVPNDTVLDAEHRLVLITGPNMAGKSTYMRQVACIVVMAQIGSFVPADRARIGVVDRILTRIGASDDLAGGASTFMVEMRECRDIVLQATPRSLLIMDEVGRGTSTFDGMSLARAIIEHIHANVGAKTLFSTHYHELTDLDRLPGVVNYTTTVAEDEGNIIFLRKVAPGKSNRSYGIHVARLAGLPESIIQRAAAILLEMEQAQPAASVKAAPQVLQMELFGGGRGQEILEQVRGADVLGMTPLDAINQIYHWQRQLAEGTETRKGKRAVRAPK